MFNQKKTAIVCDVMEVWTAQMIHEELIPMLLLTVKDTAQSDTIGAFWDRALMTPKQVVDLLRIVALKVEENEVK